MTTDDSPTTYIAIGVLLPCFAVGTYLCVGLPSAALAEYLLLKSPINRWYNILVAILVIVFLMCSCLFLLLYSAPVTSLEYLIEHYANKRSRSHQLIRNFWKTPMV